MKTLIHLHQTHHSLTDFDEIFKTLVEKLTFDGLHIFPELFLTGYPLKDIVLQKSFIESYLNFVEEINTWARSLKSSSWVALVGGLDYEFDSVGVVKKIENVVFELKPQSGLTKIYSKRLLPNYDIFDELKYFSPGHKNTFYQFQNHIFGIQICEDMWASSFHNIDPCDLMMKEIQEKNLSLSGIINLSASPFYYGKKKVRQSRANQISNLFQCPFFYVNRVGGEDEVLFDGGSFICSGETLNLELATFSSDSKTIELENLEKKFTLFDPIVETNTWEQLFNPSLNLGTKPATLKPLNDDHCEEILKALIFGLQEYAKKSNFKKFLVALSGGIDSALVLAIVKLSLKAHQQVEAIYMPSMHSSSLSTQLCEVMCRHNQIPLKHLPIKFLHSTAKNTFETHFDEKFNGLTDENIQSRLRGLLLYTRSNQTGAMVINTSNKSELAVGYSTQYGDSVGALSLLGDLYKTEVFKLSHYLNQKYDHIIPEGILSRPPSAELRENQKDEDSLPPYERLDAILEGILSYRYGIKDLVKFGFQESEVIKVLNLYNKSEYKRAQFCPILKLKTKSFGFGYRIPINKKFDYSIHL